MSPMTKQKFTPAYPAELRERGVRLFRENRADYASDTAAYRAIAPKLGCSPDSLRVWCQQAERDSGQRAGLTSAEKDRIRELEREVRELRAANEILKKASAYFAAAGRSAENHDGRRQGSGRGVRRCGCPPARCQTRGGG
ncbi:transposase [Paracoccus aestuariivivens]|uniref:transposase n=1 Tax=Paracoccus aestuariivivens TaxID=1820333 RepID=UPI003CCCEC13